MARQEHRKEDLIADAKAMVDRVELRSPRLPEPLVAGFRENGALSLYFGEDPVFHFNAAGALRRAHIDGLLYKADAGKLTRMQRQRTAGQHQLSSRTLDADEQQRVVASLAERLTQLQQGLRAGDIDVTRQVSDSGVDVRQRLLDWLDGSDQTVTIATRPHLEPPRRR